MHYSKLATTLNHQQKNRRFQAFATCEVIAIDSYQGQEIGNSLFLNITQYGSVANKFAGREYLTEEPVI